MQDSGAPRRIKADARAVEMLREQRGVPRGKRCCAAMDTQLCAIQNQSPVSRLLLLCPPTLLIRYSRCAGMPVPPWSCSRDAAHLG